MLTIFKRVFTHWRTSLEGLGLGSIAYLLTDHGVQLSISRNDKLIPTLITLGVALFKLFSTDPVNKPAPAKEPDSVIGSQVRSLSLTILLITALGLSSAAAVTPTPPILTVVSAANYRPYVAPNSICAAFSNGMTTGFEAAQSLPLPTYLAGVTVLVNNEPAGIFFASGQQVNFLLPADLDPGFAVIEIRGTDNVVRSTSVYVFADYPAIFTKNMSGAGEASAYYPRGQDGQLYTAIYATGITTFDPARATLEIPGLPPITPLWLGPSPDFVGVVQINAPLPPDFIGRKNCKLFIDGRESNAFTLQP